MLAIQEGTLPAAAEHLTTDSPFEALDEWDSLRSRIRNLAAKSPQFEISVRALFWADAHDAYGGAFDAHNDASYWAWRRHPRPPKAVRSGKSDHFGRPEPLDRAEVPGISMPAFDRWYAGCARVDESFDVPRLEQLSIKTGDALAPAREAVLSVQLVHPGHAAFKLGVVMHDLLDVGDDSYPRFARIFDELCELVNVGD